MKLIDIRDKPTSYVDADGRTCHESLLRAFHIVEKVKELCEAGTPPKVIGEMIEAMEMP
jgi:hypothetical protein